jgi:hypothetical protein
MNGRIDWINNHVEELGRAAINPRWGTEGGSGSDWPFNMNIVTGSYENKMYSPED